MCGIAGILNFAGLAPDASDRVRAMCGVLAHRGPDDQGVVADGVACLGHRRLSIIDLATGQQPMATPDGRYWITYNGEVFNYRELRHGLEARGHRFRTRSDTEVVLQLYAARGPACLNDLNGQFALAIWDREGRSLFLARDRFGILPLCLAEAGPHLLFASEAKALFAAGLVHPEADPHALDHLFSFGFVLPPRTMFAGVRTFPAGHYLLVRPSGSHLVRYWDLEFPPAGAHTRRRVAEHAEALRAGFAAAVRHRLVADVRVGVYLSGGVDSSAVAGAMAEAGPPPPAFAIGFSAPSLDESRFAEAVARHLGSPLQTVAVTDASLAASLPKLLWHTETPMFSVEPGPMLELSALTSRSVHVVLTGQGADELFAGYPFFGLDKVRRRLGTFPLSLLAPALRGLLGLVMGPNAIVPPPEAVRATEARFGCYPAMGVLFGLLRSLKGLYAPGLRAALDGFDADDELVLPREALAGRDPLDQSIYVTYKVLLGSYLLSVQGDRPSMAHAVEMRFPFLDHELVGLGAHIPPRLRHRGLTEKYILKRAMRGTYVPHAIARRRKKSFAAPYGLAFVGPHAPAWVRDLLSPATAARKGYFDPPRVREAVTRLETLARNGDPFRRTGRLASARAVRDMYYHGMAVNLILTVHLWDEVFLRNGAAAPRVAPGERRDEPGRPPGERRDEPGRNVAEPTGAPR